MKLSFQFKSGSTPLYYARHGRQNAAKRFVQ